VATRVRATTQRDALRLFHSHRRATGLRWWSTIEASWINLTIFDRARRRLRVRSIELLGAGHEAVRGAAAELGSRERRRSDPGPPVPTPFAVGRINCYLVEDDRSRWSTPGPNSATSLTALEAALAEHGRRVEDLVRIVITHQHIDHIGLVAILADRSGAEVCALDALAPWLARYAEVMEADDAFAEAIMLRHGIPRGRRLRVARRDALVPRLGRERHGEPPAGRRAVLPFAGRAWRVHHRPGHSPSDTVFHDEASGELVAGDHLISTSPPTR
jgi:glyoxylase-like metal-dependent hydrolase (beta-lactamase superfamily II)